MKSKREGLLEPHKTKGRFHLYYLLWNVITRRNGP